MVRALPKQRFLPSLLDRLTDDETTNSSIQLYKQKIQSIEKELTELLAKQKNIANREYQNQRKILQQQLDQLYSQYNILSSSISSLTEIRACVKRDLDWLLNSSQYVPQDELDKYPEITRSVLNFGIPDLTGKTVSGVDLGSIERLLIQTINNFEPRIIKDTLTIKVLVDKSMFNHNAVTFEIEGELWAEPHSLHLHLMTEFELESGEVSVYDFRQKNELS